MKPEIISQSTGDYLKLIHKLTLEGSPANTTTLANLLNVSPASVSEMIKKLSKIDPALLVYKKYQGVKLTSDGKRAAISLIRRHRLLETFLSEILNYPLEKIHDEACVLEHFISDDFEAALAKLLGDPDFTPHGEPIPNRQLEFPVSGVKALDRCEVNEELIIQQVPDTDPELLLFLSNHNLIPGVTVKVIDIRSFDGNMTIKIADGSTLVLGPSITSKIFIKA